MGIDAAKQFYPLYIHLPLLLGLTFGLKKPVGISLVSICAAYLCCQLPRCGGIVVAAITGSALTREIAYTIIIAPIFFFYSGISHPPHVTPWSSLQNPCFFLAACRSFTTFVDTPLPSAPIS